jgi:hypothetical protein
LGLKAQILQFFLDQTGILRVKSPVREEWLIPRGKSNAGNSIEGGKVLTVFQDIPKRKLISNFSRRRCKQMKKFFLILFIGLFLSGCGAAAKQSEFWEHDTVYRNWDHLRYSWYGYKKPTVETGKESAKQAWWGIPEQGPALD